MTAGSTAPLADDEFAARFGYDEYFNFPSDPDPSKTGGGSRSVAISEAERERQAVEQLIEDLEFERSLIGATAAEREKANLLRRAGAAATEEERAQIASLVDESNRQRDALQQQQDMYRQLGQAGKTALNGIASAFEDGKIEANEMLSIVMSLASQFSSMQGGGGFLASLFGGGSNPMSPFFKPNTTLGALLGVGAREHGGPVRRGHPYIVGEREPELFVPEQNGTILSSVPRFQAATASAASAGGMSMVHLMVSAEEGPMLRPLIRAESKDIAVKVSTANNKRRAAAYQGGGKPHA